MRRALSRYGYLSILISGSHDAYLTGKGGENYLALDRFEEANLQVVYQNFQHPVYAQLYGPFEPALSAVDLLFNCSPQSLSIIRQGRERP